MKFKILLIFFLTSCVSEVNQNISRSTYSSSGFAYIYNESDYINKVTSKKFNNEELILAHSKIRAGTLIKVTNPENKKFIILKVKKRTKYPEFYKVLLTEAASNRLKLNRSSPFVEIQEIKKNKSFIAGKAKIFDEEKRVKNKVPVTSVKIDNISKTKQIKKNAKSKKFSITIAVFYSLKSATFLKERIIKEMTDFDNKKISIKRRNKNSFQLISGPYHDINSLKNDYIVLKRYGFEELDVKLIK